MSILKDDRLAQLAATNNVARFASFGPGSPPIVRHAVLGDIDATLPMETLFALLLERSAGSVNVRSFRPGYDKGNPFHYGLDSATDVATLVRKLADAGYYTIVNETIRVDDGGVSGVALGGIIEFAPEIRHGRSRRKELRGFPSP